MSSHSGSQNSDECKELLYLIFLLIFIYISTQNSLFTINILILAFHEIISFFLKLN